MRRIAVVGRCQASAIGDALGVKGSYMFKKNGTPGMVGCMHTQMSLRRFIEESYGMYGVRPSRRRENAGGSGGAAVREGPVR